MDEELRGQPALPTTFVEGVGKVLDVLPIVGEHEVLAARKRGKHVIHELRRRGNHATIGRVVGQAVLFGLRGAGDVGVDPIKDLLLLAWVMYEHNPIGLARPHPLGVQRESVAKRCRESDTPEIVFRETANPA